MEARAHDAVGEFINVLESVTVAISSGVNISVADTVTATEDVLVVVNPLTVVVAETDTPTEDVVLDIQNLELAVVDTVAATESVAVVVNPLTADVVDATSVAELAQATIPLGILVFDDNTFPPLEPPPMPATGIARDYVDVEEGLAMGLGLPVVVGDDVPIDEAVAIALPLPVLVVDQLSPVDAIDATFITVQPLFAEVVDVVSPVDVAIMAPTITVSVTDALVPADVAQAALPMAAVVDETGTPAEAVDVRTGALLIDVRDDEVPIDAVAGEVSVLLLAAHDLLALTDVAGSLIPMAIRVVDEPLGAVDFAIGERRRVVTGLLEDLHLINDATRRSAVGVGVLRTGTEVDAELGLSNQILAQQLRVSQAADEDLET